MRHDRPSRHRIPTLERVPDLRFSRLCQLLLASRSNRARGKSLPVVGVLVIGLVTLVCGCSSQRYSTARAGMDRALFLQRHGANLTTEQRRWVNHLPYTGNRKQHLAGMQGILEGRHLRQDQGQRASGGKLTPGRRSLLGMQSGELGQRKGVRIIEMGPAPTVGEKASPVEEPGNSIRPDLEDSGEDPSDSTE